MFTESDYMLGWGVYLFAGLVGFIVWWRITRWIGVREIRQALRLVMLALLFTPWFVDEQAEARFFADQRAKYSESAPATAPVVTQQKLSAIEQEPLPDLAPAWIIAGFEGLTIDQEAIKRGARPIAFVMLAFVLLLIPFSLHRRVRAFRSA